MSPLFVILHTFLVLIVISVFLANRKRLASLTVLGVYTCFFFLMNYASVVAIGYFGQELLRQPFSLSQAGLQRGVLIAHIGILSIWVGASFVGSFRPSSALSVRARLPSINRPFPLGMNMVLVRVLTLLAALGVVALTLPLLPRLFALLLSGGTRNILEYRLESTQRSTYFLRMLSYNMIPFLSIALLLRYWITGKGKAAAYASVLLALFGLVYAFQKQPAIVYLLQLAIVRGILRGNGIRAAGRTGYRVRRQRPKLLQYWMSRMLAVGLALIALYYVTEGATYSPEISEQAEYSARTATSRVWSRTPAAYFYFGELIPREFPHLGLRNIYTFQAVIGGEHEEISKRLFERVYGPSRYQGSISSDSLSTYYAQFGWIGLILGGVFQGAGLGLADRYLGRKYRSALVLLLAVFLMKFAIYLNETHVFGALLGFGGLVSAALAGLVRRKVPTPLSAPPPRVSPEAVRRVSP